MPDGFAEVAPGVEPEPGRTEAEHPAKMKSAARRMVFVTVTSIAMVTCYGKRTARVAEDDGFSIALEPMRRVAGRVSRKVYAVYSSRQFVDAKIKRFVDTHKTQVGSELGAFARELGI